IEKTAGTFMKPSEAVALVQSWKDEAKRIGREEDHSNDVILSLYDYSGNWARHFADEGYDVRLVDTKSGLDVLRIVPELIEHIQENKQSGNTINVILAAPPCAVFTSSSAHAWEKMHDGVNVPEVFMRYGEWAAKHFDSPLEFSE